MRPLDLDQAIVLSAYTGTLCCPLEDVQRAVQLRLGRVIHAHEWYALEAEIQRAFAQDFRRLIVLPSQVEAFDD